MLEIPSEIKLMGSGMTPAAEEKGAQPFKIKTEGRLLRLRLNQHQFGRVVANA